MRALSLFSGAGGDTYGMEMAGCDVVGFVEFEQDMINTHLANFPNSVLIGRDVRAVTEANLEPFIDNIDILFAGFPCQSFSKAGKKDTSDSRANLFMEFVRIARIVRPKWIIGENVKHILKMMTSDNEHVPEVICRAFNEIGYAMATPTVLKAEKFGVPQKRERCFFVGSLEGKSFSWDDVNSQSSEVTLRAVLEDSLEDAINITDEQATAFGILRYKQLAMSLPEETSPPLTITGTPPLNLRKCLAAGEMSFKKRSSPTHSEIVDPDGFSKTLICTYNRMPRMFVPLIDHEENKYIRPFTVKEAKQIQGFPADYIITGNKSSAIKQIGNAVPPQLVKAIVHAIVRVM